MKCINKKRTAFVLSFALLFSSLCVQIKNARSFRYIRRRLFCAQIVSQSGNDAAIVIAEAISGSVEAFADLMNQEAKALGALDSHFGNPNGLHDKDHYTTVYDLTRTDRKQKMGVCFLRTCRPQKLIHIFWTSHKYHTLRKGQGCPFLETRIHC